MTYPKHSLSIRTRARIVAGVELEFEPWFGGTIDRYSEKLDADPRFRHLATSTIRGAVRAAARSLGRYDAEDDVITRAEVA